MTQGGTPIVKGSKRKSGRKSKRKLRLEREADKQVRDPSAP